MNTRRRPHPRYRLYTSRKHYWLPASALLRSQDHDRETTAFETGVCRRLGAKHAVCVPSARVGIYLLIRTLVPPGKEVVLSPLTIADVVSMVIAAGATPVFADVCRDDCHIDPVAVEKLIGPNTGAVLITHLYGQTAGASRFKALCQAHNLPLIEDAAQAFDAREMGQALGTWGEAGVFSFGIFKHLTTWRGGMIVCSSPSLADRIRCEVQGMRRLPYWRLSALIALGATYDLATWPVVFSSLTYRVFRSAFLCNFQCLNRLVDPESSAQPVKSIPGGYLRRMTAWQARIGLASLDRLDSENEIRRSHAKRYRDGLAALADELVLPVERRDALSVFPYFPVHCGERIALLEWAFEKGRDIGTHGLRNCADLPAFQTYHRECPNARKASRSLILLPTYPRYPVAEVERNVTVIRSFFDRRRTGFRCRGDGLSDGSDACAGNSFIGGPGEGVQGTMRPERRGVLRALISSAPKSGARSR
jgi:perosamine synthetase